MDDGRWLRLYTKTLDSAIYSKQSALLLWIHLLLITKREERPPGKERRVLWHGQERALDRGQITISIRGLAKDLDWDPSTISRNARLLVELGMVRLERGLGATRFTILTICNWKEYQPGWGEPATPLQRQRNAAATPAQHPKRKREIERGTQEGALVESIWKAAPRTGRIRSSRKLLQRAVANVAKIHHDKLLPALEAWKRSHQWTKDGGEYVPGIHKWVRDEKWRDVPEAASAPQYQKPAEFEVVEGSAPPKDLLKQITERKR